MISALFISAASLVRLVKTPFSSEMSKNPFLGVFFYSSHLRKGFLLISLEKGFYSSHLRKGFLPTSLESPTISSSGRHLHKFLELLVVSVGQSIDVLHFFLKGKFCCFGAAIGLLWSLM